MSDRVRALVWIYYNQQRFGAPRILAIALSDEADDRGGGISESNSTLAKKTEQTDRAVRKQLRALEDSQLLVCTKRSPGGPGQFSEYRIDLSILVADNPELGTGLTRNVGPGYAPSNPELGPGLAQATIEGFKELPEGSVSKDRVAIDAEDRRLAEWMLGRLRALNPGFREPSWPAWCKDIKLLRERDQRTHREIAELFAFANADQFWHTNILSPGKLRKQWERLDMQRRASAGATQAAMPADKRCSWDKGGTRCAANRVFTKPNGKGYCRDHLEELEREQHRPQA